MKTDRRPINALLIAVAFIAASTTAVLPAEKIEKRSFLSDGENRTYYAFVPDSAKDTPAPVIITLHGSGRDGRILVDHWQSMAKKEGISSPDPTPQCATGAAWARTTGRVGLPPRQAARLRSAVSAVRDCA
jgi:poly(3-hydroxybutyrate) depolymerase